MYCSKCGFQNNSENKFCKNCGILLDNNQQQVINGQKEQSSQTIEQIESQQYKSVNLNNNVMNQAENNDMKKYAILSVIVPIIAIIWYWFIGLSTYLAIFIAIVGFSLAQKGQLANKTLAMIGKVLNGILCGMAIIMLILQIVLLFVK